MTIDLSSFLPVVLYICLIVLVIVFIVLGIRLIKVLDKADEVLDEVNKKMESVNGVFNIIDKTSGFANNISDRIIDGIANLIGLIFKKKKGKDEDE